jgi:hypothetical protein
MEGFMLKVVDQRAPDTGDGAQTEPIADVIRGVIRDLNAELAEPSALGVDLLLARNLRDRLAGAIAAA